MTYNMTQAHYPKKSECKRSVRDRAYQDGSKYYFTGKHCKHGHIAWRYEPSGECLECKAINKSR